MMMFWRRRFERVLFMGNGNHSLAKAFKLVQMLLETIDFLGGHQQPAHPESEEMADRATREFIDGEVALRIRARDIVRALTDHEIQFLPQGTPVIGACSDYVGVTNELEERKRS